MKDIRERCEAATAGPWKWTDEGAGSEWGRIWRLAPGVLIADGSDGTPDGDTHDRANAEFIAHAREDIPRLLARIDELEAGLRLASSDLVEAVRHLCTVQQGPELLAANERYAKIIERVRSIFSQEAEQDD